MPKFLPLLYKKSRFTYIKKGIGLQLYAAFTQRVPKNIQNQAYYTIFLPFCQTLLSIYLYQNPTVFMLISLALDSFKTAMV